jgi:hypothetical protein
MQSLPRPATRWFVSCMPTGSKSTTSRPGRSSSGFKSSRSSINPIVQGEPNLTRGHGSCSRKTGANGSLPCARRVDGIPRRRPPGHDWHAICHPLVLDRLGRVRPRHAQPSSGAPVQSFSQFNWSGFGGVAFQCGFPDTIWVRGGDRPYGDRPFGEWGRRWISAAPIRIVHLEDFSDLAFDDFDGPHLAGVAAISLRNSSADCIERVAASRHLTNLSALSLVPASCGQTQRFKKDWLGQLRKLSIVLDSEDNAAAIAAHPLTNLESLTVELNGPISPDNRLQILAVSRHLGALHELIVIDVPPGPHVFRSNDRRSAGRFRPVVAGAAWHKLRLLTIRGPVDAEVVRVLTHDVNLPDLQELRFECFQPGIESGWGHVNDGASPGSTVSPRRIGVPSGVIRVFPQEGLRVIATSPLLGQLRRLRFGATKGRINDEITAFAEAVVPTRLEMLTIETNGIAWHWKKDVKARLGSRVEFVRVCE